MTTDEAPVEGSTPSGSTEEIASMINTYCAHREPTAGGFCPDCEQSVSLKLGDAPRHVRRVLKLATLSVNEATTYRTCPRAYYHSYVADGAGYEVLHKSFALTAGDWWHRAQEAWWLARKATTEQPTWFRAALRALDVAKPDERGNVPRVLEPYDKARLRAMVALYHLTYKDDGWSVVEVEKSFVAPLLSPKGGRSLNWDGLDGRMDLLVHTRRRDLVVVEHKTTGMTLGDDSDYWDRIKFDMQISQYIEGARANGHPVVGLVYDVARRPHAMLKENKPLPSEPPEDFEKRLLARLVEEQRKDPKSYLRRLPVVRTDTEMSDARADTWATARQISQSHRENIWPRHANSCSRYGHRCEWFGVCAREEDLKNTDKFKPKQKNSNAQEKKEIATV